MITDHITNYCFCVLGVFVGHNDSDFHNISPNKRQTKQINKQIFLGQLKLHNADSRTTLFFGQSYSFRCCTFNLGNTNTLPPFQKPFLSSRQSPISSLCNSVKQMHQSNTSDAVYNHVDTRTFLLLFQCGSQVRLFDTFKLAAPKTLKKTKGIVSTTNSLEIFFHFIC